MVFRLALAFVFLTVLPVPRAATSADNQVPFTRDIRPILSRNCFQCHGPDDNHRKAGLRLDEQDGIRLAFSPESLEESEGWQRIISDDDDLRMPPPTSHHEVKPEERALIRRWIEQGATWQGHWSFIAPRIPAIPSFEDTNSIRNPIDAFLQARLAQENLSPCEEADRERLLRRVTFDLIGLPPTIAEIDAFLADTSDEAYEKVVDRLFASEHDGERWRSCGWTPLATAIPACSTPTVFATCGPDEIGSFARTTATCRLINSSPNNSREISSPNQHWNNESPRDSSETTPRRMREESSPRNFASSTPSTE